jgi:hypothetical protein
MPYSKVERQLWDDEKFRTWDRDVRDTFMYLLTTKHQNRIGMFVLDPMYLASDVQIPLDSARASLEFLDSIDRIMWDAGTRLVLVTRHFKYNAMENPNVVTAAAKHDLAEIPFAKRLWEGLLEACFAYGKLETEKQKPFYSILVDAIQDRLNKSASQQHLNPSANRMGNGLANPSGNRIGNPEPEPEPEPKPKDGSSSARAYARETGGDVEFDDAAVGRIIDTANRGMGDNLGNAYNPIPRGHASREVVADWLKAGITENAIADTVYELALNFKPSDLDRQINSMQYFDGAVRKQHLRDQAGSGGGKSKQHNSKNPQNVRSATERLVEHRRDIEGIDLNASRSVFE